MESAYHRTQRTILEVLIMEPGAAISTPAQILTPKPSKPLLPQPPNLTIRQQPQATTIHMFTLPLHRLLSLSKVTTTTIKQQQLLRARPIQTTYLTLMVPYSTHNISPTVVTPRKVLLTQDITTTITANTHILEAKEVLLLRKHGW